MAASEVQCFSPGLLWGLVSVLKFHRTSPFTPGLRPYREALQAQSEGRSWQQELGGFRPGQCGEEHFGFPWKGLL